VLTKIDKNMVNPLGNFTGEIIPNGSTLEQALQSLERVSRGRVTPEMFGAVADFTGNPNTATNNSAAINQTISLGAALGADVYLSGRYYCATPLTYTNIDVSLVGCGDSALVFGSGNGITISQSDYNQLTVIEGLSIQTISAETGDALKVSYSTTDSLSNRNLPRCYINDITIRGWDMFNDGWTRGLVVKDVHVSQIGVVFVTGRRDPNSDLRPAFGFMLEGVSVDSTTGMVSIPSDTKLDGINVYNAQTGISVTGDVEGTQITRNVLVGVWTGIKINNASVRPGAQIFGNHINAFDYTIWIRNTPQSQIFNNLLYKINSARGATTAIYLDYCNVSWIGPNIIENSASDWSINGDLTGIELSNSVDCVIDRQIITRSTLGVLLSNGTQRTTVEAPILSGAYNNAPTARSIIDNTVGPNYTNGLLISTANATGVVVTNSLTTVVTINDLELRLGERYIVSVAVEFAKGNTAGGITAVLNKSSGTAALTWGHNATQIKSSIPSVPASGGHAMNFSGEFFCTTSGNAALTLFALSEGSNADVIANATQITIRKL
jgi:hypothetical protein